MYVDKDLIHIGRFHFSFKHLTATNFISRYREQIPYILLVIFLTLLTTLPKALSQGLGGDGQFYAVIALNMSQGIGSLWSPYFSETLMPIFYEHPPLGLGIQSIFFSLFGDSYLVEKIYSITTLFIVQLFMVLIWFRVFKANDFIKSLFWLPLLFLILIPTVTHSIGNNVLENTMAVFTIIAMYSLLRSVDTNINKSKHYKWIFLAALMIVAAILTKGPAATFLLVFFPIYMISTKSIDLRTTIYYSLVLIISFCLMIALLLLNDDVRNNLNHYLNGQLLVSIKDGRGMAANSHFYIVWALLKDLLPLFIFLGILYLVKYKKNKNNIDSSIIRNAVLFLIIGLSASLPSMISLKQNVTYIVACYPYFAIGFAILASPMFDLQSKVTEVNNPISYFGKSVAVISLVGIVSVFLYTFNGTERVLKQQNYYYDAKSFAHKLNKETIVGICSKPLFPWDIHSFFARYYKISLDFRSPFKHKYFIGRSDCAPESDMQFTVINPDYRYLKLYELKQ